MPFSRAGAELLFHVLAERHERRSVIVTTNLGFADWTQIFGEANLTAALLDRLTHRAVIIDCSWESFRLHQSLRQQVAKADKGNGKKRAAGSDESVSEDSWALRHVGNVIGELTGSKLLMEG